MTRTIADPTLTRDEVRAGLRTLVANGLTFNDCIDAFGHHQDDNEWINLASELYGRDCEIEVDAVAVVSESDGGGAFVSAWLFVPQPDHEINDAQAVRDADRDLPVSTGEVLRHQDWLAEHGGVAP